MQENSNQDSLIKTNQFAWYTSIIFFLVVVTGIVGMYLYGTYIDGKISWTKENIASIEKQITEMGQDRKMLITQIVTSGTIRPSLDLKNIVTQFRIAAAKADVGFQWFSIQDDTISTSLIATAWLNQIHPDPAATIIAMMRTYASQSNLYFRLDPITTVSWDLSKRTTGITLHVTQAPIQN